MKNELISQSEVVMILIYLKKFTKNSVFASSMFKKTLYTSGNVPFLQGNFMNQYPEFSRGHLTKTIHDLLAKGNFEQNTIELHKAFGGSGLSDRGTTVKKSRIAVWARRLKKNMLALGIQEIAKNRRVKDVSGKWTTSSVWKLN